MAALPVLVRVRLSFCIAGSCFMPLPTFSLGLTLPRRLELSVSPDRCEDPIGPTSLCSCLLLCFSRTRPPPPPPCVPTSISHHSRPHAGTRSQLPEFRMRCGDPDSETTRDDLFEAPDFLASSMESISTLIAQVCLRLLLQCRAFRAVVPETAGLFPYLRSILPELRSLPDRFFSPCKRGRFVSQPLPPGTVVPRSASASTTPVLSARPFLL